MVNSSPLRRKIGFLDFPKIFISFKKWPPLSYASGKDLPDYSTQTYPYRFLGNPTSCFVNNISNYIWFKNELVALSSFEPKIVQKYSATDLLLITRLYVKLFEKCPLSFQNEKCSKFSRILKIILKIKMILACLIIF